MMEHNRKAFVIGIAGGTASGKSTLAENLVNALGGYDVGTVSIPDTIDCAQLLDCIRSESENTGRDAVIVEGLSALLYPEIRELLDLKIFVDLDPDTRMYRRIKRNLDWGKSIDEIASYLMESARQTQDRDFLPTKAYADVIVNGSRTDGPVTEMITGWVAGRLSGKRT